MNRDARRRLGEETVTILSKGFYTSASGKPMNIKQDLDACIAATKVIADTVPLCAKPGTGSITTRLEVTTESSLAASKRLYDLYKADTTSRSPVMCLNFASAHNPGGGFLGGSQAQEESLARCSGLYASQTKAGTEMYQFNGRLPKGKVDKPHTLYSDYMLVSPRTPVFRDEVSGALRDDVYYVDFLSAPAPNAGATLSNFGKRGASTDQLWALIETTLERRLGRILAAAQDQSVHSLVLGAYGCGVFRNRPETVAQICKRLLEGPYHNVFHHVVFAVYAKDEHEATFQTFKRVLSS